MHRTLDPSRVASRHLAEWSDSLLADAMRDMDALRELDANLSAIEEDFGEHYPGVLRRAARWTAHSAALDAAFTTEVASQGEVLGKAREGLKGAKLIQEQVANVLKQYPDDKTAARVLADAETMVGRFERHEAAAAKVIRTLAKKQMPDALKKYAAKVEKLISARLVDPEKMQVIPWVSKASVYVPPKDRWGSGSNISCLQFQVVFRIMLPPPKPERGEDPDQSYLKQPRKVELIASENTAGEAGVHIQGLGSYTTADLTKGPDYFAERFLEQLRGWDGLKGEGEANAARTRAVPSISTALNSALNAMRPWMKDEAKFDGLAIEGAYRSELPKEGESAVGEGRYREMVQDEVARWRKVLDPKLTPYMDRIKKVTVSDGEKSWIYTHIALK